ncbi:hypothetical protein D9611_010904 [Ephemerocybe angulata]|uniref:Uncharacterized protein n=1 Tax=Ephemerocybe angulata TaxID=980116 RepID=A0A8H5C5K1_9AGAR|nr:hypothetical protein D9611_010904 [Tulosesus angulatus]
MLEQRRFSRRRLILLTTGFVSLGLLYHLLAKKTNLLAIAPAYSPFSSRICGSKGRICPQDESDALQLASLGDNSGAGGQLSCSPRDYANGTWVFQPPAPGTVPERMGNEWDALAFAGFEGCASTREVHWHMASNNEGQWDRFPNATRWRWKPGKGCRGLEGWDREKVVRDLVERGGWLIVGDSVSEQHFFSLSCLLYPHVIATPNYYEVDLRRDAVQNMYLNPESSLAARLSFPTGFEIDKTPLVTFRRVDILYSQEELVQMHHDYYPSFPSSENLFSDEKTWSLSPEVYLDTFTAPLPLANYATMIVSTGGHWTTSLFSGYRNPLKEGMGVDGVVSFFDDVAKRWTLHVQQRLWSDQAENSFVAPGRSPWVEGGRRKRRVIVRPYLPGHPDCHKRREPSQEVEVLDHEVYNWKHIWKYNHIFESILSNRRAYPDIHYLPIDRPGRLRPDAHATGDCLHIMTGAGVLEGWSHYISHFLAEQKQ